MRRFLLLLATAAVSTALLAPTGAQGADGYKACSRVKDVGPTGMDPADATRVRVRKVSCRTATKVIKGWVEARVQQPGDPLKVGGYSCSNDIPRIVCKAKGGKRVRFSIGG